MSKKWFIKPKYTIVSKAKQKSDSDTASASGDSSQWTKCPSCSSIIYNDDLKNNLMVCDSCCHHFSIDSLDRIHALADEGSFNEFNEALASADPLSFNDGSGSYVDKVANAKRKTGRNEAIITGYAKINQNDVVFAVMDFSFLGGSMGSIVGEKIYQAVLKAIEIKAPLVIMSASGGARMHEGILSLMQMAKTSAALTLLADEKLPFISVLTNPTMGGVTASFAMLGDVIISEPDALIGFAGPRVIEQTIRTTLPEGFQRAEFLKQHGFVDIVCDRREMKTLLDTLFNFFMEKDSSL